MKKRQEIIGLPVYSIIDGRKIGQVQDLVVNPEEGRVDFVLVNNAAWYDGAKVLPFIDVMGIGEHALTTESSNLLTNIQNNKTASELLDRSIEIIGCTVLTNKGNIIGKVSEYMINENDGQIAALEYLNNQNDTDEVESDRVLTYGAEVIIVKEITLAQEKVDALQDIAVNSKNPESASTDFFKEKQKQFLIGKTITQNIKDDNGEILFAEGTVITEEICAQAEAKGKFIELSQCIRTK